jgi:hypothetical protein
MKSIDSNKGIGNRGGANSGTQAATTIARGQIDTAQGLSNFGRKRRNR